MTRQCGNCTLCCKLLPVRALDKGAGERCRHQRHTGCRVYHRAGMPPECYLWNCRWLTGDDTVKLSRPDRSHYVIDIMPDFVTARDVDGKEMKIQIVQIWVDPDYPDAHRDPELRAYLERRSVEGIVGLVRYDASEGFTLVPPLFSDDGQWHEVYRGGPSESQHTPQQIVETLGTMRVRVRIDER